MPSPRVPSARVVANRKARVVLNRAAIDEVYLGMADGLQEVGEAIISDASAAAPRDPETAAKRGVPMMADTGYAATFALGKLVGGDTGKTASEQKPRGIRTPRDQVVLVVAFRSRISHFAELGTVKERARPFLTPAFNANVDGAAVKVPEGIRRRAGGPR